MNDFLFTIVFAGLTLAGLGVLAFWVVNSNNPSPPAGDGSLGSSPVSPPRDLEVVHVNDLPPVEAIVGGPARDWRYDAFESALQLDGALREAGYSDEQRSQIIDKQFGDKIFRKIKAEKQA